MEGLSSLSSSSPRERSHYCIAGGAVNHDGTVLCAALHHVLKDIALSCWRTDETRGQKTRMLLVVCKTLCVEHRADYVGVSVIMAETTKRAHGTGCLEGPVYPIVHAI